MTTEVTEAIHLLRAACSELDLLVRRKARRLRREARLALVRPAEGDGTAHKTIIILRRSSHCEQDQLRLLTLPNSIN